MFNRNVAGVGRRAVALAVVAVGVGASPAVASVDLADEFNVRLDGADAHALAGSAVADAGDVNGDGLADALVSASAASPPGRDHAGSVYVIYGQAGGGPVSVDLANLASRGYRIDGAEAWDRAGGSVASAGDVNHDGVPDQLIGASRASHNGRNASGSAYVVYGQRGNPQTIDLRNLAGRGYRIDGAAAGDRAGTAVANAGDVNGDGTPDALIGATHTANNGQWSGSAYVVYGQGASSQHVDLGALAGKGYRIDGAAGDGAGLAVANAGDVNHDGVEDQLIGAPYADHNGRNFSGSVYVVYGQRTNPQTIDLRNLAGRGYRIDGASANDQLTSTSASLANAGDVNGDGTPDALIGAQYADDNGRGSSGSAYVVYGQATDPQPVDLAALAGRGYRIDGAVAGDQAGHAVANAGDVNADGIPDALIGAPFASPHGRQSAGSVFVVYGQRTTTPTIDLAAITGLGYRIDGATAGDLAGARVAASGRSGTNPLPGALIGAPESSNNNRESSGAAYQLTLPPAA